MRWMRNGGYAVRIHSDLELTARTWCRQNLETHQWAINLWTNVYEHSFYFEMQYHSQLFEQEFSRWIKK